MKTVLVLAPHFPPVDTADMHRARMSMPHFEKYGWKPIVLTIGERHLSARQDPQLLDSLPPGTVIERVAAIPERLTRIVGIGNAAIRAYPYLLMQGLRLIRRHKVDLVYISTTQFLAFTLGAIWKRRSGVPFVLDMQDPWANCYATALEGSAGGVKRKLARWIHRHLESVTMPHAGGLISVSRSYIDELQKRYPALAKVPNAVLPFGALSSDFESEHPCDPRSYDFDAADGHIHGVYVGRGGGDMGRALRIIFSALKLGLQRSPHSFSRLRLHFVGTDYAPPGKAVGTVKPIAVKFGVEDQVTETTTRVPYFHGLELLKKGHFLLVPGSEDSRYTASKIIPYLYLSKPLFAVFNTSSPAMLILEEQPCAAAIAFGAQTSDEDCARALTDAWEQYLAHPEKTKAADPRTLAAFSSDTMTERQCRIFDAVQSNSLDGGLKREMVV